MRVQIEEELKTVHFTLKESNLGLETWCQKLPVNKSVRYTIVNFQGKIICDSLKEKTGDNLKTAPEVEEAKTENFAMHVRESDYFKTPSAFGALKINDHLVLRKTVPISTLKDDITRFDRLLFFKIVPFAFLSYLVFLYFFYEATRPLGIILSKVEKFKSDIPFSKSLKLLYEKDKWAEIEEALNKADQRLSFQVNEAKKENDKNAAILESIYDDIIAIDNFETMLFYNSNFKNNFIQDRSNQEIVPKVWHTFKNECVLEAFRSVLKDGNRITLKAINNLSHRHPERYFDVTITSLKGSDGKITGALAVLYDVTDFKLTEQMRVDFVANVSHEIRTPLTSVKGYAQILQSQKDKVSPDLQLFLDKIITNTERMIQLFNDLLNLSVIESKYELKLEEVELQPFIQEIADNIKTNYPEKSITVEESLELHFIKADFRLIEQVLMNLMDNACKYSGDKIKLKISSYRKDKKAYVVVTDDGPGISKEHLQRIFERFYRVDSSRETSRGTGLGLSIVKHIIGKHGGRIWADSGEGQIGTAFTIELPLE